MDKKEITEEEVEYLSEENVKALITRLLFEVEKLKDENESLWFMLEELEQSDVEGKHAISESLSNLKIYKEAFNKKPAEA